MTASKEEVPWEEEWREIAKGVEVEASGVVNLADIIAGRLKVCGYPCPRS